MRSVRSAGTESTPKNRTLHVKLVSGTFCAQFYKKIACCSRYLLIGILTILARLWESVEQLSNSYRTTVESVEQLSNNYRTAIEQLSNNYRTTIENCRTLTRGFCLHSAQQNNQFQQACQPPPTTNHQMHSSNNQPCGGWRWRLFASPSFTSSYDCHASTTSPRYLSIQQWKRTAVLFNFNCWMDFTAVLRFHQQWNGRGRMLMFTK